MYNAFYGLAKKPFNMTPDPAFLFLTEQHREALAGLTYAILDRKGFVALSGIAGAGKTTLLSWVLQKLPVTQIQSSVILNPTLSRDEFLEMAMLDFGIPDIPTSKAHRLWVLQKFLLKGQRDGKINVLVVDEAHKLSSDLLEEIRLLGNFECADQKLLQVILIGQSELDEVLNRPDLWQFKQRISVRLALKPLGASEVGHYVRHRWSVAGAPSAAPFSPEALAALAKWSRGIPRLINSLCDSALILAFADATPQVTAAHIESAARDLQLTAPEPAPKAAPAVASSTPAAAVASVTPPVVAPPVMAPPVMALATVPPRIPVSAPVAPNAPPLQLKSFDRYGVRRPGQSFFIRWASKFGLA